jgi:hypothetical protein
MEEFDLDGEEAVRSRRRIRIREHLKNWGFTDTDIDQFITDEIDQIIKA